MQIETSFRVSLPYNLHRVKSWLELGRAAPTVGQFMGLPLYNKHTGFGAITNFLWMDRGDLDYLATIQVKPVMNWLCGDGKIFFGLTDWKTAPGAKWGTLVIGGNVVEVAGYEWIDAKLPNDMEVKRHEMARIGGFRKSDAGKPLKQLLQEGKAHRAYCIYPNGAIGDSPNGEAYMPLYSPQDWDFSGTAQPEAFYIPNAWLK